MASQVLVTRLVFFLLVSLSLNVLSLTLWVRSDPHESKTHLKQVNPRRQQHSRRSRSAPAGTVAIHHSNDWLLGSRFQRAALNSSQPTDKTSQPFGIHAYESLYEKELAPFRDRITTDPSGQSISLLEIGLGPNGDARGYRLLREFFGPERRSFKYYGLEIENQTKDVLANPHLSHNDKAYLLSGAVLWGGDQFRLADLSHITSFASNQSNGGGSDSSPEFPFDIIIDDGSHVVEHQMFSFDYLFLSSLKPGGLYVIEDLHTSYHKNWGGTAQAQRQHQTMVGYLVDLFAGLHFHWWLHPDFTFEGKLKAKPDPSSSEDNHYGQEMDLDVFTLYADVLRWVETIDCGREICSVRKRLRPLQLKIFDKL